MAKKPITVTPDDQLEKMAEEAANPKLSSEFVLFGDDQAEKKLEEAKRQLRLEKAAEEPDQGKVEALERLVANLTDSFRRYQVRIPNLRASRRVAKSLAPKLVLLKDLAARAADAEGTDAMAIGLEAIGDMGPIVEQLADELPEILEALFESQGATKEWLDEHATLPQVAEAVTKQIAKLGIVELLGKLSLSGGPSQ